MRYVAPILLTTLLFGCSTPEPKTSDPAQSPATAVAEGSWGDLPAQCVGKMVFTCNALPPCGWGNRCGENALLNQSKRPLLVSYHLGDGKIRQQHLTAKPPGFRVMLPKAPSCRVLKTRVTNCEFADN